MEWKSRIVPQHECVQWVSVGLKCMNNSGVLFFAMIDVGSALWPWERDARGFPWEGGWQGGGLNHRNWALSRAGCKPQSMGVRKTWPERAQLVLIPVSGCPEGRSLQKKQSPLQAAPMANCNLIYHCPPLQFWSVLPHTYCPLQWRHCPGCSRGFGKKSFTYLLWGLPPVICSNEASGHMEVFSRSCLSWTSSLCC